MIRPYRPLVLGLLLVFTLSACTVTFDPNTAADVRPTRPVPPTETERPTRPTPDVRLPSDAGFVGLDVVPNTIYPGSVIAFRTRVRDDGFLTISAMAPNGRVEVLVRNERVSAGQQTIVPPPGAPAGERIEASEPVGTWRVKAQLSPQRTRATYQGLQGLDDWNQAIAEDLAGIDGASVIDTTFEVQRR